MTPIACHDVGCVSDYRTLYYLVIVWVCSNDLEAMGNRYQAQKCQQITYGVGNLRRRKAQFRIALLS
jgi:hypothetical protein